MGSQGDPKEQALIQQNRSSSILNEAGAHNVLPSQTLFFYDEIVTIYVGSEARAFKIHKPLLCRYSAFFKAAFTDCFAEASTSSVSLSSHDPEVFRTFVCWLYTGSFNNRTSHPDGKLKSTREQWDKALEIEYNKHGIQGLSFFCQPNSLPYNNKVRELYELDTYHVAPFDKLVDLYILSDYLQATFIRDSIITTLILTYGDMSHPDSRKEACVRFWRLSRLSTANRPAELPYPGPAITKAWSELPQADPLCEMLVLLYCDSCITAKEAFQREDDSETLHPRFLEACFDEIQRRLSKGEGRTIWTSGKSICEWHTHGDAPCPGP
ncbi:MAG: hypothetical protein Q9216_001106 [Gyalolechia sp. 2 TL-2023]